MPSVARGPIGIVAGGGALPGEVAASIVRRGGAVHVIDVNGAADAALHAYPRTVVHWSKLGQATRALHGAGVRDIVMLGTFARPELSKARPDFAFLRELPAIIRLLRAGGDDALLRCLIALFERQGLRVIGIREAAPDLLAPEGNLSIKSPSPEDEQDIATGFRLIDALGQYDIGQAAIVAGGRIVAIEAAEGTDRMLARVAEFASGGPSGVLVKRPKPQQDERADLPAIGPGTVQSVRAAGLSGIAVMSGQVLIAERTRLVADADAAGIFVAGRAGQPNVDWPLLTIIRPRQAGRVELPGDVRGDIVNGVRIVRELAAFGAGTAVVMRAGRVLAVGAHEDADQVVVRGAGYMRKRGAGAVVVLAAGTLLTHAVLDEAPAGHFAGFIVLVARGAPDPVAGDVIAAADSRGQFIAYADAEREGAPS